jgi:bifunctional non-homologous end joining protein LigD
VAASSGRQAVSQECVAWHFNARSRRRSATRQRFPVWHISAGSTIIDSEVVAPSADGTTDFSVLQNELKGRSTKIVMVAFDLLYLNGYDLRKLPLFERKALLKKLVDKTEIQFSDSFDIDGPAMFKHACKTGLEGVVSKVRDSQYPRAIK